MTQLWWFIARSTGVMAWLAAAGSIVVGLLIAAGSLSRGTRRPWLVDLHRALSGLAAILVVAHLVAVIADSFEHFTFVDVLVPMASGWRPGAVAWGIVALYVLALVELTSLARRHMSYGLWRRLHQTSFALFWLMSLHAFYAGTDTANPLLIAIGLGFGCAVLTLTLRRVVVRPASSPPARSGVL